MHSRCIFAARNGVAKVIFLVMYVCLSVQGKYPPCIAPRAPLPDMFKLFQVGPQSTGRSQNVI